IVGGELDLAVARRFGLARLEYEVERLVDEGRDRIPGDHAMLGQRGLDPASRANDPALAFERCARFQPIELGQPEPFGDGLALTGIGGELDTFATAQL